MRTDIKTLERICEDLKDSAANGEINIIDWLTDMVCAVEELAALGLKEALPLINRLNEIGRLLEIIKEDKTKTTRDDTLGDLIRENIELKIIKEDKTKTTKNDTLREYNLYKEWEATSKSFKK